MSGIQYLLAFLVIAVGLLIIVLVALQESKQQGLSGAISGAADTFFGKNKGRTQEAKLSKFTKIAGAVYFALALIAALLVLVS